MTKKHANDNTVFHSVGHKLKRAISLIMIQCDECGWYQTIPRFTQAKDCSHCGSDSLKLCKD